MIRGDRIALPAELTGNKNRQEHIFPIGPMTQAILAEICPQSTAFSINAQEHVAPDYLFPARKTWHKGGSVYNAWGKDKPRLDKRCGVTGWVINDLRRTLRSKWAELGISREVAERYINHRSGVHGGVAGVYDRYSYMEPMKRACATWERYLSELVTGTVAGIT